MIRTGAPTSRCICLFRTAPWHPHDQRCPMHSDKSCHCACHLTDKVKSGHHCGADDYVAPKGTKCSTCRGTGRYARTDCIQCVGRGYFDEEAS